VTFDPPKEGSFVVVVAAKEVEMSALKRFLIILGAIVLVASCTPNDTVGGTTSEAPASLATSPTLDETTTSSVAATTPSTIQESTTSSVGETATTPAPLLTIEDVVAVIQSDLDEEFAASDPPEGVLGAYQVQCRESEQPVNAGDVFACAGIPQTEPDFQLDPVGVVIFVIDETPNAAWLAGTDVPDTTDQLLDIYQESPHGLYCRDLLDDDITTWFSASGTPPGGYFLSLVYWSLEGHSDRMDADRNGIPCENLVRI